MPIQGKGKTKNMKQIPNQGKGKTEYVKQMPIEREGKTENVKKQMPIKSKRRTFLGQGKDKTRARERHGKDYSEQKKTRCPKAI